MSYAAWWEGQYSDPGADLSLGVLATTGTDWISLIVTGYQDTFLSTTIDRTSPHTPTDADLIHVINAAHNLGLKVMLKPHVDLLDESDGHWRGHIGHGFTTQAQWTAWFTSYRDFIEHYADLAQTYGADQFCVGTELLGTTHRESDWRAVVAGVRAKYNGHLVYAALHGGEEVSLTWWDAVDYIGVDGYYPLNDDPSKHPTVEELEAAWEGPKVILADLSAANGNTPIIFTELGYRSHHGCSCHPWDSVTVSPVDLEEQAYAYEAAFRQLYHQPWLSGIYWWTWFADRFKSGPCDDSFTPYQKPAENILRTWYGGTPSLSHPVLLPDDEHRMDVYTDELAPGWADWSWNGTVNLAATDQRYKGARSIAAILGSWGAISLKDSTFNTSQYHWLEFYVRGSSAGEPNLVAFFETESGTSLPPVPVNDCRHINGGTIDSDTWKLVRIPLRDMNVQGVNLTRLNIQNQSEESSDLFWIDEIRLMGAKESTAWVFLPLVLKSHVAGR
jgi:hypothetical protein